MTIRQTNVICEQHELYTYLDGHDKKGGSHRWWGDETFVMENIPSDRNYKRHLHCPREGHIIPLRALPASVVEVLA